MKKTQIPAQQTFGFDAPAPPPLDVPPAPTHPDDAAAALRLPPNVWFGSSSWAYPGWAGLVYGRPATSSELAWHGLHAYATHPLLGAVGIDRSYYAPVPPGDFQSYRTQVESAGRSAPARWLVKVGRDVLQPFARTKPGSGKGGKRERNPSFLNADLAISGWVAPASDALGAEAVQHLVQFSPMGRAAGEPARFAERLHAFLQAVREHGRIAVELRDRTLFTAEYVAALLDTGAQHCINLLPEMPTATEQHTFLESHGVPATAPVLIRWLRSGELGHEAAEEAYDPFDRLAAPADDHVAAVAGLIGGAIRTGATDVVTIVDNKAEGCAPLTIRRIATVLALRLEPGER